MEGNYLFKVKYWSDTKGEEQATYYLIPADSMTEAVKRIEDRYGADLLRVECDWKEHELIHLTEAQYYGILSGGEV